VETRLNLLLETLKEKDGRRDDAIQALGDATRAAAAAVKAAMDAEKIANDLRYQQRFEAQSDALAAAFLSQQTAMQTAFVVAEKAVQAALAAADRAVSKAELAADKRFEALNELRQMLNDMVATLITRVEAGIKFDAMAEKIDAQRIRIDVLEARVNAQGGGVVGAGRAADAMRSNLAMGISIVVVLVLLWRAFTGH
jgi:hypothetical protein